MLIVESFDQAQPLGEAGDQVFLMVWRGERNRIHGTGITLTSVKDILTFLRYAQF
jgi:co-chaperonin GroES (HSP10)